MTEFSRPWGGTTLGDAGPYTDDDWADIWERFLGAFTDADTGVLSNVANELLVTGAVSPMSVDTGVALVDGTFYLSDVAVAVPIASPAALARVDRVVLRKTWATQVVRVTLIAGVEGGGAPALVQIDGTTWDLPLFQASIAVGGAITLTDERERLFTRHPSMTTAERDAMTPVDGMIINNETTPALNIRENGAWRELGIADVVDDVTPQAGGDFDLQANLLVGNGGATGIAVSAAGEVNMAAQPAFLAINSVQDANVTGAGANVTVDFDTEVYDQGGDFAADVFTAPITGRYILTATVRINGLTAAATNSEMLIVTSNRTFRDDRHLEETNPVATSFSIDVECDMDAADTALIQIKVAGMAGNNADIDGNLAPALTFFSGKLAA